MEDSDVGKIWASVLVGGMKSPEDTEVVKQLIVKLVEVKCRLYEKYGLAPTLHPVLEDLNIDPATWTKE